MRHGIGLDLTYAALGGGAQGAFTGGISFANGYPLDSVTGVTVTIATGVGALTAAWNNGPLCDLTNADGGTMTLNAVGPGYPDVKSLAAFVGVDARIGIGAALISKWYNQVEGSPNSWVQATAGSQQPMLYLIKGKVYVGFGGCLTRSDGGGLTAPWMSSTASIDNQDFTFMAALSNYSSSCAGGIDSANWSAVFGSDAGSGHSDILLVDQSTYVNNAAVPPQQVPTAAALDFGGGITAQMQPSIGIQPQVFSVTGTGTETAFTVNETTVTGAALQNTGTNTPLLLGIDREPLGPYNGRMWCTILWASSLTTEQELAARTAISKWAIDIDLGINKANKLNVIINGASTDLGQGSDPMGEYKTYSGGGYGMGEVLKDALIGNGISWHNMAISSSALADQTALWTSGVMGGCIQSDSTENVVIGPGVCWVVTYEGNGSDPTATFNDYKAYIAAVKAAGVTRIASFVYPNTNADPGVDTYQNNVISYAADNGIDIIDMRGETQITDAPYANPDGHPTVAGSTLYASFVLPYLRQFL